MESEWGLLAGFEQQCISHSELLARQHQQSGGSSGRDRTEGWCSSEMGLVVSKYQEFFYTR